MVSVDNSNSFFGGCRIMSGDFGYPSSMENPDHKGGLSKKDIHVCVTFCKFSYSCYK